MLRFPFFLRISLAMCLSILSASFAFSQRPNLTTSRKGLPVSFELNRGQIPSDIDFVARGDAYTVYVRGGRASLHLNHPDVATTASKANRESLDARINLVGASETPELLPEGKLPGHSNFLFGSDPAKWITGVVSYAAMRYANVYPGIDLLYHGNQDRIENDFIVRPGADPRQITLSFSNARKLSLNNQGDLVMLLDNAEFTLLKPRAYQFIAGKEVAVAAAYVLEDGQARFHVGQYDLNTALTIDPVLVYATFFGGGIGPSGNFQTITAAAVDAAGNLYVVGVTDSTSLPVTPGAFSATPSGDFLAKFDPTGATLIYSTYFTGITNSADQSSASLVVDASGNAFVAGHADPGLPIPSGAHPFQSAATAIGVLKFDSTGSSILAGTYFGGSGGNGLGGIAIDTAGNIYLTGSTSSTDFPTQTPLQASLGASQANAFVSKLDPALSTLMYSTYLGQASSAGGSSIAVDAAGNAYVVGSAGTGFPTTTNAFQATAPMGGAFLAKLDPTGTSLQYATYVSGSTASSGSAVGVDASGNIFVAGQNPAPDFPILNSVQTCTVTPSLLSSGFVSELDSSGALVFSSCLATDNSTSDTSISRLTVDPKGKVFVLGATEGTVVLMNPIDSNPKPNFVSEIDATSHALVFSTYVAGPGVLCCDGSSDHATSIAIDSNDNIYVAGWTSPQDGDNSVDAFPVFNARQPLFIQDCTNPNGDCSSDAFIMKISPNSGAAAAVFPSQANFAVQLPGATNLPSTIPLTVVDLGTDPLTISSIVTSTGFTQTNNCTTVAASGGTCTIQVTLAAGSGPSSGILTITDSSAGSPHIVDLLGPGNSANTNSFSLSAINASASVSAGASAAYSLAVTAGSSFSGAVQLACSDVPVGVGCSVNPSSVTLTQGQLDTVSVNITTTAPQAAQSAILGNEIASAHRRWLGIASFAVFGVVLLPILLRKKNSRGSNLLWCILPVLLSIVAFGCGSGSSAGGGPVPVNGTPTGTYTIVIIGSSGGANQKTNLMLTVQ
jgi:beta-propeller repeat-containing protein